MKTTSKKKESGISCARTHSLKNAQQVPLDINGSLADISDFGEDIVSEAGSASGGISSHDGSKNDTDSDYITEPSIISAISSSFNRRKVVAILQFKRK